MHAQIGKGGGFHLAEAERLGRSLPVHVHVGGPALVLSAIAPLPENVPEVLLASLVMGSRLRCAAPRTDLPLVSSAELCSRAPSNRRAPAEGPSAITTLLLGDPRLPGSAARTSTAARTPSARDGRGQAAPGGLLHRRLPAGAAAAPREARHAGRARPLELRRDRLPLAGGCGRARALPARGHGQRLPHPRGGPALADEVPPRHRPRRGPARLRGHPPPRPRARGLPHGPLRALQRVDGLAGLRGTAAQRGFQGRAPRTG